MDKLFCVKCKVKMEPADVNLEYLGHRMTHKFPVCPVCGQIFIPEDIVSGKMHQVETELEDK
ncbi:MAG: DNA-binding protein [Clostridiales bacterium]|nr:DNA-binding protein [Clostridiales bacterium]